MKKIITIVATLCACNWTTYAQDESQAAPKAGLTSDTYNNFNMPEAYINIRDYVYLPNKAKMIIELNHAEQYDELKALDKTIGQFFSDIAFYRDSLENAGGNVRIDYTLDDAYPFSKIRVKSYPADGSLFMKGKSDVSRLKIDQDTVHLYIRHSPVLERPNKSRHDWGKNYKYNMGHARFYQITFCLNSYKDLQTIAEDNNFLVQAMDTLQSTKRKSTVNDPHKFPSSALYHPFGTEAQPGERCNACSETPRFRQYNGLAIENTTWKNIIHRSDLLSTEGNFGMGLVRNTFAPYVQAGISFTSYGRRLINGNYSKTFVNAFMSGYFMFEKDINNEYLMKENLFVNLSWKSGYMNSSIGAGYLISGKGSYFKGKTAKIFFDITLLKKGLTLSPELIFTNDFRQVFPGLTLKVF